MELEKIKVELKSLESNGDAKKTEDFEMDIHPIYESLTLSIGECIYSIDNKGHIKEKLAPQDPYSAFNIFIKAGKLKDFLLEGFPENYRELIFEAIKELPEEHHRKDFIKQFVSLTLHPILSLLDHGTPEYDYIVEARKYAVELRNEIDKGNEPKIGKVKIPEQPRPVIEPEYIKEEKPGFFKRLFKSK